MTSALDEPDRAVLLETLAYQRRSVLAVLDGLPEDAWHVSTVPSGWTPAGMVVHLGNAERHWTCDVVLAADPGHAFDADRSDLPYDPHAPFVSDWTSTKALTYYADQARATDDMLAVTPLDGVPRGRHGDGPEPRSVREVVLHLIEETAAHSGHLEVGRELLDGRTGLGLR